ncbi:MAG: molybdopterin cofactor-binding domain-containing protein, partial [Leeuwenhoekiella sp.]
KYSCYAHCCMMVEVHVDEDLGIIRVARVVNASAAGKIINPKTAENQLLGATVWGIGMALEEEGMVDKNLGRIMNANLAEYHIPVHADIKNIEIIFVEEKDDIVNPLGAKGVGELGMVGVAAAISNAVYNATGKRIKELPIKLDHLL